MSVQSEIDRINGNVASTYNVLEEAGAEMPQTRNTDNLPETVANFATEIKQKYGKLVVFGDSLGAGENNDNYSFVDILSESGVFSGVVKACVSGATVGPYQVASSARNYDLNAQIERYKNDVTDADIIICEYGANDVYAMANGKAEMGTVEDASTATTICGYVKKSISRIYALNPDVTIHWVFPVPMEFDILKKKFANMSLVDGYLLFWATAMKVARNLGCFLVNPFYANTNLISSDGTHPNTQGHILFADTILSRLFTSEIIGVLERPLTLGGDTATMTNLTVDSTFANALKLAQAGVNLKMQGSLQGFMVTGHCIMFSEYAMVFSAVAIDTNSEPNLILLIYAYDGTVSLQNHSLVNQQSAVVRDYLYKNGDERMVLTYGTGASNAGTTIDITAASNDLSHQVISNAPYDVTSKTTTLVAEVSDAGSTAVVVGIATAGSGIKYFNQLTRYKSTYRADTVRVDLSDITGQYYPIITTYGGSGTCKITNWYFEEEV